MSVINSHTFLANVVQIAYNIPNSRPQQIQFLDITLTYVPEKSKDIYAHYVNEEFNVTVVGFHGAKTLEEALISALKVFSPTFEDRLVNSFCEKYKELIELNKTDMNVFLCGHSMGCFAIAECSLRFGDIPAVFFAPYNPRASGRNVEKQRSAIFVKILYASDWLANPLISQPERVHNVIVLDVNTNFTSIAELIAEQVKNIGTFNVVRGMNPKHPISNFTKSAETLNRDLVQKKN